MKDPVFSNLHCIRYSYVQYIYNIYFKLECEHFGAKFNKNLILSYQTFLSKL